jgi:hypothetical protein
MVYNISKTVAQLQMNLKEKLSSLKNHALLLFGPSSFEHWFKSCKSFSVRTMLFSEIANQSSAQFLPLLPPSATASSALFPLCTVAGAAPPAAVLRPSAPRSTCRATLPPTALGARAGHLPLPPRRAEAPNGRHAALADPPAPPPLPFCAGRVLFFSPLSFFQWSRACPIRPSRAPPSVAFSFPPPGDPQHRSAAALLPPEILPTHTTPLRFHRPRASPPPPLAPQLDPVQPRPSSSPDLLHPEPPLHWRRRNRPRRRQPASPPLRPSHVRKSTPHTLLVLVRALFPRVRRPFAGNDGVLPRPPHLSVSLSVPLLSTVRVHPHSFPRVT